MDAATFEMLIRIFVDRRVWHMAFSAVEDQLFTTNGLSGDVAVIDVKELKPQKSIKVGGFPSGIAALRTK